MTWDLELNLCKREREREKRMGAVREERLI
jgi:hypothetical protein